MSDNFQIGSSPIDVNTPCFLKFHQFTIYDSQNWTQTGVLKWNAATKEFFVEPDVVEQVQPEPQNPPQDPPL